MLPSASPVSGGIGAAENTRGAIYHRMLAFFADYDILATPTVITPSYDIRQRYLMENCRNEI